MPVVYRPLPRNMTVPLSERIIVDPKILAGKPIIRGTRLAV